MTLKADFATKFPEITPINDAVLDNVILEYKSFYNFDYIDDKGLAYSRNHSILFCIAHIYTLNTRPITSGSGAYKDISSKSVKDVSVTYAGNTGAFTQREVYFNTTFYGQKFLLSLPIATGGFFV